MEEIKHLAIKYPLWDLLRRILARKGGTSHEAGAIVYQQPVVVWQNKWWWLTPMLLTLLGLGILIEFVAGYTNSPFIYSLFGLLG